MVVAFAGFAKATVLDRSAAPVAAREPCRKSLRFIDSLFDLESRDRGLRPRSLERRGLAEESNVRLPVLSSKSVLPPATSVRAAPCRIPASVLREKRFWHH